MTFRIPDFHHGLEVCACSPPLYHIARLLERNLNAAIIVHERLRVAWPTCTYARAAARRDTRN